MSPLIADKPPMTSFCFRRAFGAFIISALAAGWSWAAEDQRSNTQTVRAPSNASSRPGAARAGTAKGMLPDPALLDGSTLPVEKKSETGMIGDFELPGDENNRSGKVGGPQNPNGSNSGGQSNAAKGGV